MIGAAVVLVYTLFGGMWSVAFTDLFQTVIIVLGLLYIAWLLGDMAGGFGTVIGAAAGEGKLEFWPKANLKDWIAFVAAWATMAIGSIAQQDVFQRVTSAKDEKTAVRGTLLGGTFYLVFAFVPMFIAVSALLIEPDKVERDAGRRQPRLPADPAAADPVEDAAVRAGDVLRRAAVGDPVDRQRRAARADRGLHRERAASRWSAGGCATSRCCCCCGWCW